MQIRSLQIGIAPMWDLGRTWLEMIHLCMENELDAVEFKYDLPFMLPDRLNTRMMKQIAKIGRERDLVLSVHAPMINIGSLLRSRWQEALDEHLNALEAAEIIGAKTFTVHLGWLEKRYATDQYIEQCFDLSVKAIRQMQRRSGDITICVENEPPDNPAKVKLGTRFDYLEETLHRTGGNTGFVFDIGHANLFGDPLDLLFRLRPERVCLSHLHDNDGKRDLHLPVGKGTLDWSAFFHNYKKLKRGFPLYIEVKDMDSLSVSLKAIACHG